MFHLSTHPSTQETCLRSIREDLRHYYKLLTGYFHPERSPHTLLLLSLKELMEVTNATTTPLDSTVKLQPSFCLSFYEKLLYQLCLRFLCCFCFFVTELLHVVRGRQLDFPEGKVLNFFEVVHCTCVCFFCKSLLSCSTLKAAPQHLRSYGDRLRLCKMLSGFRVRTITINRAIAYMSSGEHMQWLSTKIFIAMKFSITMMRETVFINNHQFMTDAWYIQTIYFCYLLPFTLSRFSRNTK